MRTARAKIRDTRGNIFGVISLLRIFQLLQASFDRLGAAPLLYQNRAQLLGNHDRVQRIACLKQFFAVHGSCTATLVPAIDPTPAPVVKNRLFDLHLDQLALFFDDNNQIKTIGPFGKAAHIQRERLPHLIRRQAQPLGVIFIKAQQRQRMHQIKPVFARRDKPDLGAGFAPHALVHLVGMGKGFGGEPFIVDHPRLLGVWCIRQTDVQPALWHLEIGGGK